MVSAENESGENTDTLRVETSRRGHLTNALDVLNGQTAGVTVGSNTNPEAMLSSVHVRGNHSLTGGNEPLVIIDGMSSDLRTLATIFPGDIESFTILKDAAQTAQYGARGAAGYWRCGPVKEAKENFISPMMGMWDLRTPTRCCVC